MVKFLKYADETKIEFRSAQALSMGGATLEKGVITLYAPRLPPLRIQPSSPEVAEPLFGLIIGYLADPEVLEGFPSLTPYGMDLNVTDAAVVQSMKAVAEGVIDEGGEVVPAEEKSPIILLADLEGDPED